MTKKAKPKIQRVRSNKEREGFYVTVDPQIISWRRKRRALRAKERKEAKEAAPKIQNIFSLEE